MAPTSKLNSIWKPISTAPDNKCRVTFGGNPCARRLRWSLALQEASDDSLDPDDAPQQLEDKTALLDC